ncbi:MAG: CoA-binding protein [Alkaliphilus sp.]|nr:CoA-binding protein [bacterium AH-315-G05]PHS36281.1 MAG: CoA-binding protein [Alkaliphilus sp.]
MSDLKLLKEEMLESKIWAVIGASENTSRFGYKIYKKLKQHGYEVYPVNPNYKEIDGDIAYSNLSDLPKKPDCVNIVVNPKLALNVLDEIKSLDIKHVWFQPRTFNKDVVEKTEEYKISALFNKCVLRELG